MQENHHAPLSEKAPDSPRGLGGWLILPLAGLFVVPLQGGVYIIRFILPVFADGSWKELNTPGKRVYHPLWGKIIPYEIAMHTVLAICATVLVVLFLQKLRIVPRLMIAFYALHFSLVLVQAQLFDQIPEDIRNPTDYRSVLISLAGLLLLVPYFLRSRRVRNTFVN